MNVYCVKERKFTPNVMGTERVVITKNHRSLLKVKCASCGKTKARFIRTQTAIRRVRGKGLLLGKNSPFNGIPLLGDLL